MKTPFLICGVLLFCMADARAQSYSYLKKVDIFGDSITTVSNNQGKTTTVIKRSKDIFGNKVICVSDENGNKALTYIESTDIFGARIITIKDDYREIARLKNWTDIFGNENKLLSDGNGKQILKVEDKTDIFGNSISTITNFVDQKTTRHYMQLFDFPGCRYMQ